MSKTILNYSDSNGEYDEGITIGVVLGDPGIFFNVVECETGNSIFLTMYQIETMLSFAKEMTANIQETSRDSIN